jgi:hypothetical protein
MKRILRMPARRVELCCCPIADVNLEEFKTAVDDLIATVQAAAWEE